MPRESVVFGASILVVIVGLAALLFGEASHGFDSLVYVGGAVVLVGVGVMTGYIARLDGPAH